MASEMEQKAAILEIRVPAREQGLRKAGGGGGGEREEGRAEKTQAEVRLLSRIRERTAMLR